MTGVSGFDDDFGDDVSPEPSVWVLDELGAPEPDWLEHAFATGEWPDEAALPGREVGAAEWAVPGVEAVGTAGHPVLDSLASVRRSLADAAAVGVSWLDARQTGEVLVGVHRVIAQASALAAVLTRHAETVDLAGSNGSPSAAVWVAHATKVTRRDALRLARIGDALGDLRPCPSTTDAADGGAADGGAADGGAADRGAADGGAADGGAADGGAADGDAADGDAADGDAADGGAADGDVMRSGTAAGASSVPAVTGSGRYGAHLAPAFTAGVVNVEQADVIVKALDALPGDLDALLLLQAESALVGLAADHDAKDLRVLGKRILTVIAPEIGEAHDAAALEKEERDARAKARLTMVSDGQGHVHGRFTLPGLHGAMLKKALEAFAAPGHKNTADDPDARFRVDRPTPARMGEALCELLETLDDKALPDAGGTGATVVVTMTLDSLRGGLAHAWLDTGDLLSATEARRLACEAGIIPAVLGGSSEVLDLGRASRLFTKAQRIAMALRDGGCIAEGCNRPPHQCHAHHLDPWARGGPTNLDDGGLLCGHHHRRAHDPRYTVLRLGTGKLRFTRRS